MAIITIGTHTLTRNPQKMTVIRADKACAKQMTYTSAAFFSWGTSIIGKEITLEWPYMTGDEFDALDTIFKADAAVVFDPNDGIGKTYNVEMSSFDGDYFFGGRGVTSAAKRTNVKMTLIIMSEAT